MIRVGALRRATPSDPSEGLFFDVSSVSPLVCAEAYVHADEGCSLYLPSQEFTREVKEIGLHRSSPMLILHIPRNEPGTGNLRIKGELWTSANT